MTRSPSTYSFPELPMSSAFASEELIGGWRRVAEEGTGDRRRFGVWGSGLLAKSPMNLGVAARLAAAEINHQREERCSSDDPEG